MPIDENDAIP